MQEAPPSPVKPPRNWRRGVRIALEIAILFGLLAAIDHGLTGGTGFADVRPSPYWMPVLVMALVYGTGPGVVAAAIASAFWLVAAHGDGQDRDYLDTLLHLSLPPLLWGVAAVTIGEVTLLRQRRLARAVRRATQAVRDMGRMADAHDRLTRTNRILQRRVATDPRTMGHVVAIATRLSAVDPAGRHAAMAELIELAASSDDFTCYRLGPDGAHGWLRGRGVQGHSLGRPDMLPPAMTEGLADRPGIRHVARRSDREWLAGLGVAAVPLADAAGAVRGLLLFHSIPIEAFNAHRIAELAEIAGWLGPLLFDQGQGGLRAVRTTRGEDHPAGRVA
jgi:hypothetical protein